MKVERKKLIHHRELESWHPNCPVCGKKFVRTRYWNKYCSTQCKWKQWDKNNPRQPIGDHHGITQ